LHQYRHIFGSNSAQTGVDQLNREQANKPVIMTMALNDVTHVAATA
jgi:hypothetical protein